MLPASPDVTLAAFAFAPMLVFAPVLAFASALTFASVLTFEPALAFGPVRSIDFGSLDLPDVSQAVVVSAVWVVVALFVGAVLVAGFPRYTRTIRHEAADRPSTAFAYGFVSYFGLLVGSSLPFFVGASIGHEPLTTLGLLVAVPGLLVWAIAVILGGCFGLVIVGDRLRSRARGLSPGRNPPPGRSPSTGRVGESSSGRSLLVGTLVLAPTQLVPILGTVVTIGVVTVGGGAVVRRWAESRWPDDPPSRPTGERGRDPSSEAPDAPTIDRVANESEAGRGSAEARWET